jgi:hypothetical protein
MAASVKTMECYPEVYPGLFAEGARHDDCPGGHVIPGVLGGWRCPCPCHNSPVEGGQ